MNNQVILGDSLEKLKELPDNSVDSVVTDPPYGLNFMGKKWDYDVPQIELWKEVFRVLKHGGYLLSFAGTRTYHRMAVNIEDAGFEIRDMISWLYGSGFPKSLNIGKQIDKIQGNEREIIGDRKLIGPPAFEGNFRAKGNEINITKGNSEWEGWGTALKPAVEPIVVARKPLSEKNVALNVLKWGTGGINIDDCRIGTEQLGGGTMPNLRDVGKMSKESMGIDKLSFGQNPRPAERKEYPTYQGRFPANIILDEEAGKILDEQSGISKSQGHFPKDNTNGTSIFNTQNLKQEEKWLDKGGASRFFYCAKASKKERNLGCEEMEDIKGGSYQFKQDGSLDGKIPIKKNKHPTVKPLSLIQYLIKLVSKEGAVVLDPFLGSGTTAIACVKLNRQFIGIEKEEEYVRIAKARLKPFLEQRKLK